MADSSALRALARFADPDDATGQLLSVCCTAFTSDTVDPYEILEFLSKRTWSLTGVQNPPAVHLSPTLRHAPVDRYVHPDEFELYKKMAYSKGFFDGFVESTDPLFLPCGR